MTMTVERPPQGIAIPSSVRPAAATPSLDRQIAVQRLVDLVNEVLRGNQGDILHASADLIGAGGMLADCSGDDAVRVAVAQYLVQTALYLDPHAVEARWAS